VVYGKKKYEAWDSCREMRSGKKKIWISLYKTWSRIWWVLKKVEISTYDGRKGKGMGTNHLSRVVEGIWGEGGKASGKDTVGPDETRSPLSVQKAWKKTDI